MDKLVKFSVVSDQVNDLFVRKFNDKCRVYVALAKISRLYRLTEKGEVSAGIILFESLADLQRIKKFYREQLRILTKRNKRHSKITLVPEVQSEHHVLTNNPANFALLNVLGILDELYVQFEYAKTQGMFIKKTFIQQRQKKYARPMNLLITRICQLNTTQLPIFSEQKQQEIIPLVLENVCFPIFSSGVINHYRQIIKKEKSNASSHP